MDILVRVSGRELGERFIQEYDWPPNEPLVLPAIGEEIKTAHGHKEVKTKTFIYEGIALREDRDRVGRIVIEIGV